MRKNGKLPATLLCLLLLCALCLPALAEEVNYIYYTKNDKTNAITRHDGKRTDATLLTGGETVLNTGWYVAADTLTYNSRLTVTGNVHLILADECTMFANEGITVNEGTAEDGKANSLSIYAQSEGNNMGALTVSAQGYDAVIGGAEESSSGLITIHGGMIKVTPDGDVVGAGIGGGGNPTGQGGNGTVTIYGGTVTATANGSGAGIGGGNDGNGTVEIHGGTVTATGYNGAGIGGGNRGSGTVKIYDGTVTATAMEGSAGAAIGGGLVGESKVEIYGGTVMATASGGGAAIGNGINGIGVSVTVKGGSVSAVNTVKPDLSIGGSGCAIYLGLMKKNDYVYAAGYTAKDNTITLTAPLQDAGTGVPFPAEGSASEENANIDAEKLARMLLIPIIPDAAKQYAWNGASFSLPGNLTEIGNGAFRDIRAARVLVPQGVRKIGEDAFRGSGVKRIKFENGNSEIFDASAFADCPFVIAYAPKDSSVYTMLTTLPNVYVIGE